MSRRPGHEHRTHRRAGGSRPRGEREVLRRHGGGALRVPLRAVGHQDRDRPRDRGAVRRSEDHRDPGQHDQRARQGAPPLARPRPRRRAQPQLEEGRRHPRPRSEDRRALRGGVVMPIKRYKPTSPGRRFMSVSSFEEVTRTSPEKSLTEHLKKHSGRTNTGSITVRHRGGGHKKLYRIIDFKRNKVDVPGRVAAIEYDPNRSSRIALIHYADGEKRYILSPLGLSVGDTVMAGPKAEVRPGNSMPLANLPLGTTLHNIELQLGRGGQMVRSDGGAAQLLAKEGGLATLRLPSGEVRRVDLRCSATVGQVGNVDHENETVGKAGKSRWRGWRPSVRGMPMNPFDHPHGGGEGRSGAGGHPQTPWGKPALGFRTRHNKSTDRMIVRRRKK